ncbi:unnamed protein product [Symbiodinium sp. CCMP2592]|nr:unnamed protein product [Symbiodinium sp. CCMP2592]
MGKRANYVSQDMAAAAALLAKVKGKPKPAAPKAAPATPAKTPEAEQAPPETPDEKMTPIRSPYQKKSKTEEVAEASTFLTHACTVTEEPDAETETCLDQPMPSPEPPTIPKLEPSQTTPAKQLFATPAKGDTQIETQLDAHDDLSNKLQELLEAEYEKIDTEDDKAEQVDDQGKHAWSSWWDDHHEGWSSQSWTDWSWDRWDSWTSPWGRSWSRKSWSHEDWHEELQRGPSVDLAPYTTHEPDRKDENEQDRVYTALNRQQTSWLDQSRPAACPLQDQEPSRPKMDREEPTKTVTAEQQAPIPPKIHQQAESNNTVTPEHQAPIPPKIHQQAEPKNTVTPEQQAPIPPKIHQQAEPKNTVTPEQQQAPIPPKIHQQAEPKNTVTPEQQQAPIPAKIHQQAEPKNTVTPEQQQAPIPMETDQQDPKNTDQQDPATTKPVQVKEEQKMGGPGDEWRCDKRGRLLKPHALYMRFYRNIRSSRSSVIGRRVVETVSSNSEESEDMYEFWSYRRMVDELGQDLADDLVARHKKEDPNDMYRYKNYARTADYKRKKFETSAEFECTAQVEEEANNKANNELTEQEGFETALLEAGVGQKMMDAMMDDLAPALQDLKEAKATVAIALGKKKDDLQAPTEALLKALLNFKKLAVPLTTKLLQMFLHGHRADRGPLMHRLADRDRLNLDLGDLCLNLDLLVARDHDLDPTLVNLPRARYEKIAISGRNFWEHFRQLDVEWAKRHPAGNDHVPVTLRPILHRTCWSLQAAFAGRRPQSNPEDPCLQIPKLHSQLKGSLSRKFAVAEFKGDWDWHKIFWQLRTQWQARHICHLCRATRNAKHHAKLCFVLFGSDFPRRTFEECLVESMPDSPIPLVLCEGFHPGIIRFCAMHVLALGIFQTLCAEALLWMVEHRIFCPAAEEMDEQLRHGFMNFKSWLSKNKLACSGRVFTMKCLHVKEQDYPFLGYKAFNCRIVLAWCAATCFAFIIAFALRRRNAAVLCDPEIQQKICQRGNEESQHDFQNRCDLNTIITSCVFLMSEVQNDLESMGRYLSASESEQLYSRGQQCLRFYREAALIFASRKQLRFFLRPKLHALDELLYLSLRERYNPRFYQNYAEEDVLGLLKPLAQKAVAATARNFEVSMLKRYFLRWDWAEIHAVLLYIITPFENSELKSLQLYQASFRSA